jgi:uncharacterized membrane protein YdjX (TVP38/TMEM64 family)
LALAWLLLPIKDWASALQLWVDGMGAGGVVLFAAIYVCATLLLFPSSILSVLAGFVFAFWGIAVVAFAATTGATLAFLLSRYFLRGRIVALARRHPQFDAVDKAIGADGWKVVALLRLSPLVPFNLQNYLFGATGVKLTHFTVATLFAILPGTVLSVSVGAAGGAASRSPLQWWMLSLGLAASAAAVYFVARKARAVLQRRPAAAGN